MPGTVFSWSSPHKPKRKPEASPHPHRIRSIRIDGPPLLTPRGGFEMGANEEHAPAGAAAAGGDGGKATNEAPSPSAAAGGAPSSPSGAKATAPRTSYAEPPKWRFVNAAKKSLGYSSTAAGTYIKGRDAEELAAKYVAPQDSMSVGESLGEEVHVGKVAVPSTFAGGTAAEPGEVAKPTMKLRDPKAPAGKVEGASSPKREEGQHIGDIAVTSSLEQGYGAELQKMQKDVAQMQQESLRLRVEILEAESKKQELERETLAVREEKERTIRGSLEKERMISQSDVERGAAAAVPIAATTAGDGVVDTANEISGDDKRQRNKTRCLYGIIALLICAIAAILGVMLSGGNSENNEDNASNLKEGGDVDSATKAPTTSPTASDPVDPSAGMPPPLEPDDSLECPPDTKRFDLTVNIGDESSHVNWLILDHCTLDVYYRCPRCYMEYPANSPVQFSACLPLYNSETGAGMEYVLQMIDISGPPSFGYELRYDGEVIADELDGFENSVMAHHFGDGDGCSEAPSTSPSVSNDAGMLLPSVLGENDQPSASPSVAFAGPFNPASSLQPSNFAPVTSLPAPSKPHVMSFVLLTPRPSPVPSYSYWATSAPSGSPTERAVLQSYPPSATPSETPSHWPTLTPYQPPLSHFPSQYPTLAPSETNSPTPTQSLPSLSHWPTTSQPSARPSEESRRPTESPTKQPVSPPPTFDIALEAKPGCTPFVETSQTCASEASIEFKLLLPRGHGTLENQMFGSSVAFVGNSGRYAAVGTRVPDSPVHIFRKVQGPLGEDDFLIWQYTASVELPTSETFSVLFGISIASNDEGYIAVGAPLSAGGDSGKVFVYRPNADFTQWDLVARLTGEIGAASFGSSVAFDGRLIAVGSLDEFNGKGAVYVFEFTGMLGQQGEWTETVKLSPPDLADGAEFGGSVSLFGDSPPTLAVGAPKDTGGGSAFVYIRDDFDWVSQKLLPRDIQDGDEFGSQVAVSGCTVAVSSINDATISTTGTGTVRMFDLDPSSETWVHSQIIEEFDVPAGEIFGQCIALEGNTLLVGSPWGGEGGVESGIVYHFERFGSLWSPITATPNKDFKPGDVAEFGCPLDLSRDLFLVGNPAESSLGPYSGSAYVYDLCPNTEQI